MPSLERWRSTWQGLDIGASDALYKDLVSRYAEPHRHYHTGRHLDECFVQLDAVPSLAERLHEVELALWFHDAVYAARASDNEAKSAEWARAAIFEAGGSSAVAGRVHDLVLATRHDETPSPGDATLLVDVDLAILGADVARFDEYERQIRQEYAWVPGIIFRKKRRAVLEGFLARPQIYGTAHFRERLERRARENLARSIRQLGG